MGDVIFKPSAAFMKKAGQAKPRRKRKPPITSKSKDPRIAIADRTFEITRCYPLGGGDSIIERRIRIRVVGKGGLEDEIYEVGGRQQYVGLISEHISTAKGRDNWSPYTWGHVPVDGTDWAREIVSEEPTLKATKKDEPKDV